MTDPIFFFRGLPTDRILDNPESRNIKVFRNTFDVYWEYIPFKNQNISLVLRTRVIIYSVKYDQPCSHHAHEV